ncbi:uncharacterized protein LOC126880671 [Diabrotica virgifera virgifera]|uniref:Peptidase A2 domain-containing protein n=1 Tax=Diabrotica virgifera virgifera TaxID=50390 RepID=A0ABM5JRW7_DIAVI|nr:uncharacterized protein LOC126880671 [Diabrotica virgifera virgifera]
MDEATARSKKKTGKSNITRVETWIRDHLDQINSKFAIAVKLDMLKEAFHNFNDGYNYLEGILPDGGKLETREETDALYLGCFDILSTKLDLLSKDSLDLDSVSTSSTKNVSPVAVRLPEFSIHPYSGKITEWDSFFQIFDITILKNDSLSDIQKLMYLKSYVRGEPAKLISNFPVVAKNLKLALDTLVERYGNKYNLTKTLFLELLDFKPVPQNANHIQLRDLYVHVSNKLKALDNLNLTDKDKLDWILILLVEQKLDSATLRSLEFSREQKAEVTFEKFLNKIQERATHLENLVPVKHSDASTSNKNKSAAPTYNRMNNRVLSATDSGKISCQHYVTACPSKKSCVVCQKNHATLLHFSKRSLSPCSQLQTTEILNSSPSLANDKNVSNGNNASIEFTTLTMSNKNSVVLLGTINVFLYSKYGRKILVKALIDPGSQLSFITEELANRLKYPTQEKNMSIYGLGISLTRSQKTVNIVINSSVNSEKMRMSCGILSKITNPLPQFEIDSKKLCIPSHFVLADSQYYVTSDIHLLIGADYCYKILVDGMHHMGENMPTLQNSRMGWIIAGTIPTSFIKNPSSKNSHAHHACFGTKQLESIHTSEDASLCVSLCISSRNSETLEHIVQKFWCTEDVPREKPSLNSDELIAEKIFVDSTVVLPDGRYQVDMPFRVNTKFHVTVQFVVDYIGVYLFICDFITAKFSKELPDLWCLG